MLEKRVPGDQQTAGRYTVVPRTLIFLEHNRHLLLLCGAAHKWFAGRYNGLGGHVEPGEDVHTAALREVEEESGLRPDTLHLRGVVHVTGPLPGVLLFIFHATVAHPSPLITSDEGVLEWVPLDRLEHYPLLPDVRWLIPHVVGPHQSLLFATFELDESTITVRTADGTSLRLHSA
ncbi:MAG: NUDIX domain-containing protein [Ardenticatenia bacterium]|nr:NUDIX domain-containing protein [Ardenticatenia bacterium]